MGRGFALFYKFYKVKPCILMGCAGLTLFKNHAKLLKVLFKSKRTKMALLDYGECSSVGDIVTIENNSVLAIVTKKVGIPSGINNPYITRLHVYPFVGLIARLRLRLQGKLAFEGQKVDDPSLINPVKMIRGKVYQM